MGGVEEGAVAHIDFNRCHERWHRATALTGHQRVPYNLQSYPKLKQLCPIGQYAKAGGTGPGRSEWPLPDVELELSARNLAQ